MSELPPGNAVVVFADRRLLMQAAADRIVQDLGVGSAVRRLVLPGGTTPIDLYRELSARRGRSGATLDPARVRITFTDERAVPPEDEASNYGMIRRELLDPLAVPPGQVLRIRGERPAERAAEIFQRELIVWNERVPLFDLVVLGLGEDGHVASLFPGQVPEATFRLAIATRHPSGAKRISLTPRALRSTPRTLFLVAGEDKAPAVRDALEAPAPTEATPSRLVVDPAAGKAVWLLDEGAASLLPPAWK